MLRSICFDGAVKRQISFWGRIRRTCCQPGLKTEARLEKVTADVCDSVWKKWQESIFRSFVNVWLLQKVTSEDWGHECYLSWSLFVSVIRRLLNVRYSDEVMKHVLWLDQTSEKRKRDHMYLFEFVCQMTSLLRSMKVSCIGPKTKSSLRPQLHSTIV